MIKGKTEIEKLNLNSLNIAEEKQNELLRLFPEIRTEGGKIDIERLKLVLGESVDTGKERYGMNWPGKAECFKTFQAPSMGTLRPSLKESINFEGSQNIIIEGDNLEALKLLQKSYLNQIQMIYIDPPYNTGKDFIYPDDYSESLQTYLEYTGQTDTQGKKFGTNPETDGRFHSKWINMMYPRLYLAKNLLAPTGAIFVSIDDSEVINLMRVMDEIFGEERRLGIITVVSNLKGRSDDKYLATAHNYLLAYGGEDFQTRGVPLPEEYWDEYPEVSNDGRRYRLQGLRKRGSGARRVDRPNMYYPFFVNPLTKQVSLKKDDNFSAEVLPKLSDGEDGRWRWGKDTSEARVDELIGGTVGPEQRWDIFQIDYAEGESGVKRIKPKTVWMGSEFSNEAGNLEVKKLFGKTVFDTCKPVGLITYCIEQAMDKGGIALDFFAGSGTTAQAILEANANDGGDRKFILVQLPEHTEREDFKTISDITKERVRRVIENIKLENFESSKNNDLGFKSFKLDSSNFKVWDSNPQGELPNQLELHVEHILRDRSKDDILYEILIKSGFPPSTKVETQIFVKQTVYSIAGGMLLVCLEDNLNLEMIKYIAEQKPERVVCLDQGFANNDQLKANAVQIFRTKGITSFKTV